MNDKFSSPCQTEQFMRRATGVHIGPAIRWQMLALGGGSITLTTIHIFGLYPLNSSKW